MVITQQVDLHVIQQSNGSELNDTDCEWYYNKDWWKPFNLTPNITKLHSIKNLYEIGEMYNYSIPFHHINKTKLMQHTSKSKKKLNSIPASCAYKGKIFNIGIQKTGTTSLKDALLMLNYQCNQYDPSNIRFSCEYHQPERDGYYIPNPQPERIPNPQSIRLYSPFHVDDISFAFINKNYTKDLYLATYVSDIFADQPWAYLYPIFDEWYPSPLSKFIYTVRKSTYVRVNSAIRFELETQIRKKKLKLKLFNESLTWNGKLQNELIRDELLKEFIVLNARVYEKHHENVLNYFDKSRIGDELKDDVLILCIECEKNPWKKIFNFLGCKLRSNVSVDDIDIPFPHALRTHRIRGLREYSIPQNMSFDWNGFKFGPWATNILNIIYNQTNNKTERLNEIKKYIWKVRE